MPHVHQILRKRGKLTTVDAVIVPITIWPAINEQGILLRVTVTARGVTSDSVNNYILVQSYKCAAGVLSSIGPTVREYEKEQDAAWDVDLTLSGANVIVNVKGDAAENVRWTIAAEVYINEDTT